VENRILITGFGGQGILFTGKFLAHIGMRFGKEITWLPSYGPEMRGGTAYCAVILSDGEICSPIISNPDVLICMNTPSLDKFENTVVPGGLIITDSSLIDRSVSRDDVRCVRIPATKIADDNGLKSLANMVIAGKTIRQTGLCEMDILAEVMRESVSERKKDLFDANMKALELGYYWDE